MEDKSRFVENFCEDSCFKPAYGGGWLLLLFPSSNTITITSLLPEIYAATPHDVLFKHYSHSLTSSGKPKITGE